MQISSLGLTSKTSRKIAADTDLKKLGILRRLLAEEEAKLPGCWAGDEAVSSHYR